MKTMGDVVADSIDDNSRQESNHHASVSKELGQRTLRSLKRGLGRLWRRHRGNASITEYDPSYKVAYLGNVLTGWAKGEGCVEKPVSTLWRNYVSSNRPDVTMRLTVTNGGLTATTKDHGLTEYWAHRVTYCTAPVSHPRLFVWVYRHEGRRLRPELRCHAALCSKESTARRLASTLNTRLHQALLEFRRDKVSRQNARLSLANAVYENPSLPRRKILLSTGGQNYKPPLERSKSAPKLSAIEEDSVAEEIEQKRLLEELRSLENVARSWQDQDGWRLARLVDALNRAGASSEYSDENGSISSGCETASTSNSEERAPGIDDTNHTIVDIETKTSNRRVLFSDDVLLRKKVDKVPRRNSDGSPNFLNFNENTRFSCSRTIDRNRYLLSKNDNLLEEENEEEEEEEEAEEEEEEVEEIPEEEMESSNVFDFEDTEVFDEIVDYRPHGESPSRLENITGRHLDVKDEKKYLTIMNQVDELLESVDSFVTLGSLDEEEADSDESGYVEAPPIPKVILNQNDNDNNTKINGNNKIHIQINQESPKKINHEHNDDGDDVKIIVTDNIINNKNIKDDDSSMNNQLKLKDREKVDFIKCPISETIKKLANASLRNSKSFEISTNTCLKALNTFKNTKTFDENNVNDDRNDESPSLHQRKQLLAQHGVTV